MREIVGSSPVTSSMALSAACHPWQRLRRQVQRMKSHPRYCCTAVWVRRPPRRFGIVGGPPFMARTSAESEAGSWTVTATARRSDRFLRGLEQASRVTFVSHVHPDPDSLGSMLGLAHLVECCLNKPTRLTRDGPISRAENRAMVEALDLELIPVEDLSWAEGEAAVMVDSQPNTGRHNLDDRLPLYAVIDHHDTPGDVAGVPFL